MLCISQCVCWTSGQLIDLSAVFIIQRIVCLPCMLCCWPNPCPASLSSLHSLPAASPYLCSFVCFLVLFARFFPPSLLLHLPLLSTSVWFCHCPSFPPSLSHVPSYYANSFTQRTAPFPAQIMPIVWIPINTYCGWFQLLPTPLAALAVPISPPLSPSYPA